MSDRSPPTEYSKLPQPGTHTRIIENESTRSPHPNHQICTCLVPPPESSKLHLPGTPTRIIKISPARLALPFSSKLCYPTRTIKIAPAPLIVKIAPARYPHPKNQNCPSLVPPPKKSKLHQPGWPHHPTPQNSTRESISSPINDRP